MHVPSNKMNTVQNLSLNRYEWASSLINSMDEPVVKVFDIGARDGEIFNLIKKNIEYTAFDLAPKNDQIIPWDLTFQAPEGIGKCDVILLLDVLEHLNNPWICIKNLVNTLKLGGKLILTTPNPFHSEARFTLFAKGWMPCFSESDLILNHHVFTPWPHVINKLLADNGIKIEEILTLDGKTVIFDKKLLENPFRIFKRIIKWKMENKNKMAGGMSLGIIARKIND